MFSYPLKRITLWSIHDNIFAKYLVGVGCDNKFIMYTTDLQIDDIFQNHQNSSQYAKLKHERSTSLCLYIYLGTKNIDKSDDRQCNFLKNTIFPVL